MILTDCLSGHIVRMDVNHGPVWRVCPSCRGKGCKARGEPGQDPGAEASTYPPPASCGPGQRAAHHRTRTPDGAGVRGIG